MIPEDIRRQSQKLFGAFWRHMVKGELPNIFDLSTAKIIIAFLLATIDILKSAFPNLVQRRKSKRKEPKQLA